MELMESEFGIKNQISWVDAVRRLKMGKAVGEDRITFEGIKGMGEDGISIVHTIWEVWDMGVWPKDWYRSVFISIHKKSIPTDCNNYQTIALIPNASKTVPSVINERLEVFLLPQTAEEQSWKGTREQILNVRQIIEKLCEYNMNAYLCFVDYSKAFYSVNWRNIWKIMTETYDLIGLLKGLYENNTTTVRINDTYSSHFKLRGGVR